MHHFACHSCCLNTLCYPTIFLILFNAASTTNQISNSNDDPFDDFEIEKINNRKLLSYNGDVLAINPSLAIENFRLKNAYIALQAWKEVILSDYYNLFCWPSLDEPSELTVAGIDINHGDIAGKLPHELGLLYDIALFHINSNRFCGTIPESFLNLKHLFELDLSNNRFVGKFPDVVVQLPNLRFLDLRFNEQMVKINELLLTNNNFHSCLPNEIGILKNLIVFDVSNNQIVGTLPETIGEMESLEQLEFERESKFCLNLNSFADHRNCFRGRPMQRSALECRRFLSTEVDCSTFQCALPPPIPPPPPPPPPSSTNPPQNTRCTCLPPPSSPIPTSSPQPPPPSPSPHITVITAAYPTSPTQNSSSPPPSNFPSTPPSFVEPLLPSPLPCANRTIPSNQDLSPPSLKVIICGYSS
ncbi:unnamed protein product [Withania somnifera]